MRIIYSANLKLTGFQRRRGRHSARNTHPGFYHANYRPARTILQGRVMPESSARREVGFRVNGARLQALKGLKGRGGFFILDFPSLVRHHPERTMAASQALTKGPWMNYLRGIAIAISLSHIFCSKAGPLDNWRWRNPSPQANPLYGIAFGGGRFV